MIHKCQYYCSACQKEFEVDFYDEPGEPEDRRFCPRCKEESLIVRDLSEHLLVSRGSFFMKIFKDPLRHFLVSHVSKLKIKPTHENSHRHNTHTLIDIWDWFLEKNEGRPDLFKALRNIHLTICDSDGYYDDRQNILIEKIVEAILDGKWQPRSPTRPNRNWPGSLEELNKGKGYQFIQEKYEQGKDALLKLTNY